MLPLLKTYMLPTALGFSEDVSHRSLLALENLSFFLRVAPILLFIHV